jgi:hypothetical protein
MDRRSWPWKKKSSDKAAVEKAAAASNTAGAANQADQVNSLISVLLLMETVLFWIFFHLEDFLFFFHLSCLLVIYS